MFSLAPTVFYKLLNSLPAGKNQEILHQNPDFFTSSTIGEQDHVECMYTRQPEIVDWSRETARSCFRPGTSHQFTRAPSTLSHQLRSLSGFTHCTDGEPDVRRAGDCLDTHRSGSRDRTGTGKKPGVPAFSPVLIPDPAHSLESFRRGYYGCERNP